MDRTLGREHLAGMLEDLQNQRKVGADQLLMELIHFVFELDEEVERLGKRISRLEAD